MQGEINKLLMGLTDVTGLPVYADVKDDNSEAKEYITFNLSDDRPELFANNAVKTCKVTFQVHIFVFGNPEEKICKIKQYFCKNNVYWLKVNGQYESDTKYRHSTIEAFTWYCDD